MPAHVSAIARPDQAHAPVRMAGASRKSVGESFQDAMKILVAMVQNQSPDQPMDAKEFGDQVIKFMSVEQNMKTNENLNRLIQVQHTTQTLGALGVVGHEALVEGQVFEQGGHPVTFHFNLAKPAQAAVLLVQDLHTRQLVRHVDDVPLHAGPHDLPFDGRGDDGQPLPAGLYKITVLARDEHHQPVQVRTGIRSRVTGVRHQEGEPQLMFGQAPHGLERILEVRQRDILPDRRIPEDL
jgi:flagellar basal-body rod modification protein FlgD